jgi:hypothetical protein
MPAYIVAAPEPIFGHKQLAVSGTFDGHEMQTTGLSFSDFTRMQTRTHKPAPFRTVPEWALCDQTTRAVIIRSLDNRALST